MIKRVLVVPWSIAATYFDMTAFLVVILLNRFYPQADYFWSHDKHDKYPSPNKKAVPAAWQKLPSELYANGMIVAYGVT
jgi:hypothetical protein